MYVLLCGVCMGSVTEGESEAGNQRLVDVRRKGRSRERGQERGQTGIRKAQSIVSPRHLGLELEWTAPMQKLNGWLSKDRGGCAEKRGGWGPWLTGEGASD